MAGRKHHNLKHLLSDSQRAAALELVAGPGASLEAAGERILLCRQKELQQLFQQVYNVATNSFNNEWLRRKLLTAVGLPPSWRPAPVLAPELPSCRPEECSRYGRRRRRVQPYGAPVEASSSDEGEWEGEEREASPAPPPAIRRRPSFEDASRRRPSLDGREGSADSAGTRAPAAVAAAVAAVPAAAVSAIEPASSGSGSSSGLSALPGGQGAQAILAMQARAAAAFAPLPQQAPTAAQVLAAAAPLPPVPVPAEVAAQRASPVPVPPLHALHVPASFGAPLAALPLAPRPAQQYGSLAALLSAPGSGPAPGAPLMQPPLLSAAPGALMQAAPQPGAPAEPQGLTMIPVPGLPAAPAEPSVPLESLSAQLHDLFGAWDEGRASFSALSFDALL